MLGYWSLLRYLLGSAIIASDVFHAIFMLSFMLVHLSSASVYKHGVRVHTNGTIIEANA